jgi:very-short-patch-repair endonuclease
LWKILDEMGVEYEDEYYTGGFWADAFLPQYDVVVEADGVYWHGHPKLGEPNETQMDNMETEVRKDAYLIREGYTVVRIWGSDLRDCPEAVKHRLRQVLEGNREVSDTPGAGYLIEAFEEPTVQATLVD